MMIWVTEGTTGTTTAETEISSLALYISVACKKSCMPETTDIRCVCVFFFFLKWVSVAKVPAGTTDIQYKVP